MIYLGADHRGFELKARLYQRLVDEGKKVVDLGNDHFDPEDDYVDFAQKVAGAVTEGVENKGILLCGSGVGMDIAANKIKGVRCALAFDALHAKMAREHEDVNIISLPADILDEDKAWEIIKSFLDTPFSLESRHVRRLAKIAKLELL